jgi:hypothetical protein
MHQAGEQVLNDVLLKYGSSSCDTPQMLETLLRKHGRGCPQEMEILVAALRRGIVSNLRLDKGTDVAGLARALAINACMSPSQAQWAVTAWASAIACAPACVAAPSAAEAVATPPSYSTGRAAAVLTLAAATGAIAYLTFG